MKSLVFDTGPLISLAMNNLLWILKPLKEKFNGEFYITESVRKECIERPLESKKFKYEAIQMLKLLQTGVIKEVKDVDLRDKAFDLLGKANSLFKAHDNYIRNVHFAEVEVIAAAMALGSEAIVIDEFVTRKLIEDPIKIKDRMEKKLHMPVHVDNKNLEEFKEIVKNVRVIRSVEMVTIAYELEIFKDFYLELPEPKKTLLEGLLWGLKLNGCSISEQEISDVLKIENLVS